MCLIIIYIRFIAYYIFSMVYEEKKNNIKKKENEYTTTWYINIIIYNRNMIYKSPRQCRVE